MSKDLSDSPATLGMYSYAQGNPLLFNDPDGRDAVATIQGTNVTIKASIYIWGSGATAARARAMQTAINRAWDNRGRGWRYTHPVSKITYTVHFDVSVEMFDAAVGKALSGTGPLPAFGTSANVVKIINQRVPRSEGTHGRSFVRDWNSGIWSVRDELRYTATHEFGHFMKLKDRYTERGGPNRGWWGNIMAQDPGRVQQKNINVLMKTIGTAHKRRAFGIGTPSPNPTGTYTIELRSLRGENNYIDE
jgi:hypothetical protein